MRVMVYWTVVAPEAVFHGSRLVEGEGAKANAMVLVEIKRSEGARFVAWAEEEDEPSSAREGAQRS